MVERLRESMLTGKLIPRPKPIYVQEPVIIRKKSRIMEEYEAVFGKSGRAQAQTEAV